MLLGEYNGQLPQSIDELIKLPGIGRKTANVVLNELFEISEGIVVDTHVKRISNILGLTKSDNPEKIEKDLMEFFEKKHWLYHNLQQWQYGKPVLLPFQKHRI